MHFPSALFQKWQCVEDPTGKLRLYKCKGMASLYAPRMQALMAGGVAQLSAANSNGCKCGSVGLKNTSVLKRKRMLTKKSTFLISLFWYLLIDVILFWKKKKKKCSCSSLQRVTEQGHSLK